MDDLGSMQGAHPCPMQFQGAGITANRSGGFDDSMLVAHFTKLVKHQQIKQ
jgi:hypothetical protein